MSNNRHTELEEEDKLITMIYNYQTAQLKLTDMQNRIYKI